MTDVEGTPGPSDPTPFTPPARGTGYMNRLMAAVVAAILIATGGGLGIGWNLARIIAGRQPAVLSPIQVVTPAPPPPGAAANPPPSAPTFLPHPAVPHHST